MQWVNRCEPLIRTSHLSRLATVLARQVKGPGRSDSQQPRFLQKPGHQHSQHVTYPKAAQVMSSPPRGAHMHMVTSWLHFNVPVVF